MAIIVAIPRLPCMDFCVFASAISLSTFQSCFVFVLLDMMAPSSVGFLPLLFYCFSFFLSAPSAFHHLSQRALPPPPVHSSSRLLLVLCCFNACWLCLASKTAPVLRWQHGAVRLNGTDKNGADFNEYETGLRSLPCPLQAYMCLHFWEPMKLSV